MSGNVPAPASVRLLLAVGPDDAGARALLVRAREVATSVPVAVLLAAEGLAWSEDDELEAAARRSEGRIQVALCSADARERGRTAEATPDHVAWSSRARFLALGAEDRLWTALP